MAAAESNETSGDGSYLSRLRVAADEARSLLVHISETGVCDNWTEPGHVSLSQVCLDAAAKLYAAIEGSPEKADGAPKDDICPCYDDGIHRPERYVTGYHCRCGRK